MIKFIIAAALIISGCFFGSIIDFSEQDIAGKENEILNSSFEEGQFENNPIPLAWTVLDNIENSISTDSICSNFGKHSLKISHPTQKISLISEAFPLDDQGVYFSRCYLKTNYQSNHAVEIIFVAFNSQGKQVDKFKTKAYPQENWTKVTMSSSFFKPNARFGRIIITFPKRPDKIFWLDDVESYHVYQIKK